MTGEYCCSVGEYFDKGTETCIDLPDDCDWWDYHDELCGECTDGHYLNPLDNKCCDIGSYYDAGPNCIPITEVFCIEHYDGECQKCADDYFLTEEKECHKISAIFNRCEEFDYFEKKCKKCTPESTKQGHYCCAWNEFFSPTL